MQEAQAQNVGIGITQPEAQLHVNGTNFVDSPRGTLILSRYWESASNTRATGLYHRYNSAIGEEQFVIGVTGGTSISTSPLLYSNAKMVIQSNGKVGIGTTNPSNRLSVTGNADFSGNVGIGTATPNTSAALDVTSTTKGFLPPRMNTSTRDAIASPVAGLTIYNTSNNALEFWNGTAWISTAAGAASVSGTIANIYNINGLASGFTDNTAYNFISPYSPIISVTSGQKVIVTATIGLGSNDAGGATLSKLNIGFLYVGSAAITDLYGDYISNIKIPQTTRMPFTLTETYNSLIPGPYYFGMIYQANPGQSVKWNNNDWVRVQVIVVN